MNNMCETHGDSFKESWKEDVFDLDVNGDIDDENEASGSKETCSTLVKYFSKPTTQINTLYTCCLYKWSCIIIIMMDLHTVPVGDFQIAHNWSSFLIPVMLQVLYAFLLIEYNIISKAFALIFNMTLG